MKRDFERVSRYGRPVPALYSTIRWFVRRPSVARVGIVVGLKVSKRATIRNLVKRRVREVFRRHLPSLRTDTDLVIYTRPPIVGRSYRELADDVGKALARARLLRSPWVDILGERQQKDTVPQVSGTME